MTKLFLVGVLLAGLTTRLFSADGRTYTGDRIAVSINGTNYAGLVAWSGGEPRAVVQTSGNKKHVSGVTYDPIVLEVGAALQGPLLNIVKDFCAGSPAPVSLQLFATSYPTLEASAAVLTKVAFPALDGSAKEAAHVVLTFVAPSTRYLPGPVPVIPVGGKIKPALASSFRLSVNGLPSNRIAAVSSLVISRETGRTDVSNLQISISSTDADAWEQWRDQFLRQGQNSEAQEKTATLSLLDTAMKSALLTLTLSQVGLVRVMRPEREPEKAAAIEAELYIESVSVSPTPVDVAQAEPAPPPVVAPAEPAARINDKESDLAGLLRRKQSLETILATQEKEKKSLEPTAQDTWEKTRLPVLTKLIADSKADLAQVNEQIKVLNQEVAAAKAPTKNVTPTPVLAPQKQKLPASATQSTRP